MTPPPPDAATRTPKSADVPSLWRNGRFVRLWSGQTVSEFGSQVTQLALPLTAITVLNATPQQIGYINAALYAPVIVLVLVVGVLARAERCLPLMMVSNAARVVLLGTLGLLGLLGLLSIGQMVVIALLIGSAAVVFDVCYQTIVPEIVARAQLVDANSKLQSTYSAARASGPALGGLLIQWLSAPAALLVDALSFAVSVGSLLGLRRRPVREVRREASPGRRLVLDMVSGLRFMLGEPHLRALAVQAALWNFFIASIQAVFVYYAATDLRLSPAEIGLATGSGAIGSFAVSLFARGLGERFGVGPTIVVAVLCACFAPVMLPLASGAKPVVVLLLAMSFLLSGMGTTLSNIQAVSLRQALSGPDMLSRVNASHRFLAGGALPLGAVVGGSLGAALGARESLLLSSALLATASLSILATPVRRLRKAPAEPWQPRHR